ncbi:condensation domain-containing protein [Streptomyces sp. NBC_00124]|uniref:condensation domain-containing protein n=1 Tax=Streptomyces sp. NBC_00124 TaxID=2975662 RepID=UPI002256EACC|nr:condensation domain-containing protein [Streptomyces sp. NBC_00124]MCX5367452.1 condensation domain-containing protein [Streptomyces sp. NBC_00124]
MTVPRSSHAVMSVVVDPGPVPHDTPWDLELRGPLDAAALAGVLGELADGDPDRAGRQHRLLRHGPDHHTLRFTPAEDTTAAFVVGRLADLLTERSAADHPLTPAQCAALTPGGGPRHEAVYIEPAAPLDADAVREALRAVLTAHPQLGFRLDSRGGRLSGQGAVTAVEREEAPAEQGLLVEGEFTDEAGFTAAVDSIGRTLDAPAGVQLRALLARDRRPAGERADRLVLVAHELAVDAASWRIVIDDLVAALGTATAGVPARPRHAPGGLADWVTELRELARDPAEIRHWSTVAERRARGADSRTSAHVARLSDTGETGDTAVAKARDAGSAGVPEAAMVGVRDAGPFGARSTEAVGVRRTGFALSDGATERITQDLAQRLTLTVGQVLTGVFALALARWQHADDVSFDVRSGPRTGHPGLRRHVGRLTDVHPVHLTLDRGLATLGQLAAVAGPLAAAAGQAAGGAGFGACREWSPDPLLRTALRELAPAQACLTLHGPDELLPPAARPVPDDRTAESGDDSNNGSAPHRPPHRLQVCAHIADGRLHFGLDWVPDPAENITDTSVAALGESLREVLGELTDASDAPIPSVFRATPQQAALYLGGDGQPGTGRHVEQVVWVWHGPLDLERFTAAWQSVFDCETVLRTAFTGGPEPQLMVHSRVAPEITRRVHRGDDWSPLLERDRLRGFDLRCPGALRLTLLETDGSHRPGAPAAPTRIVLTYHRALLDNWSAHILLREFYRAYLAGGSLPGGERRPDLRDYAAWIAAQDLETARAFWARSAPPDAAASKPGRSARDTAALTGVGRARLRLTSAETIRLALWAGRWGIAESTVLQAVWAMLIYRASDATGPTPVCFAVTAPGRGIPLDGAARMLGPLRNALPMSVEVDPAGTVPNLLRQLRDRALDMAAYEWVPVGWLRAHEQDEPGVGHADTVIVFEDLPHPVKGLEAELAAHGIKAEFPGTVPARSVLPIGLLAHHDSAGRLILTRVHDRDVLDEKEAAELLVQSATLLRELPSRTGESTTVAEILSLLEGRTVPRMTEPPEPGRGAPLVTLRAARREPAGTICLVPPPGTPATCYDLLSRAYTGYDELLVLTTDADGAHSALAAHGTGRYLLLGGFSGAGSLACDIARRIAADGGPQARVVVAGVSADDQERARELARALKNAGMKNAGTPDA